MFVMADVPIGHSTVRKSRRRLPGAIFATGTGQRWVIGHLDADLVDVTQQTLSYIGLNLIVEISE